MRAALLVMALFAGCAAEPAPPTTSPLEAASSPLELAPCDILEAIVEVPSARAARFVPPGFSLAASGETTSVVLGAAACAQGSRAFLAIAVEPEDERLRAEGVRHFFESEHLVAPGEFADELARLRGNATPAEVVVTADPPQPSFVVSTATSEHRAAAVGGALAPAPEQLIGGVFREWFPSEGGYGYLEATFGAEGARLGLLPATIETGEGTISREVIGPTADAQLYVLDESAYAEATLGFVPYP